VLGAQCALIAFLVTLLGGPAGAYARPAVSASGAVETAAGHDTNMFLMAAPDAAGSPRIGGAFAQVAPALILNLSAAGSRLDVTYTGDHRFTDVVGRLSLDELGLSLALPELGPLRASFGAVAGRLESTRYPDDGILFAAGDTGLRLALGPTLRLLFGYRLEARTGTDPDGDGRDLVHVGDLRLSYRPKPRVELASFVGYIHVVPPDGAFGEGSFRRLRGGIEAGAVVGRTTVLATLWTGPLMAGYESPELHVGGRAEARVRLFSHLDFYAAAHWSGPVSRGGSEDYARRLFAAGLALHATTQPALPAAPSDDDLRPVVQGHRVRFRLRSRSAAAVEVVGSWNDWATPGRSLAATREEGLWEAWVELPPGAHRYRFRVDGADTRPPAAFRYAPDGFGGADGVVDVSGELEQPRSTVEASTATGAGRGTRSSREPGAK
jgi:hypothetical protein